MPSPVRPAVAYYRVSTTKQGTSGLDLEAQQVTMGQYAAANGLTIAAAFTEVESGRKRHRARPEAALDAARWQRAVLLIAKLDQLSRNMASTSTLMDAGVDFVAVDMPTTNRLTVHVMAAMAD